MATYNNTITIQFDTLANGNAGAGKSVTVFLVGTETLATLTNRQGGSIVNPLLSDNEGNYTFDIDPGFYDVIIDRGLPTQIDLLNEGISTGGDENVPGISEKIPLSDSQVNVTFSNIKTQTAVISIQGQNVDQGNLISPGDYIVLNDTEIQLKRSYPGGSILSVKGFAIVEQGTVTSVFARANNVVAQSGDYTASQVTNVPAGNVSSTDVQVAINELDGFIATNASDIADNTTEIATAKLNDAIYNKQTGTAHTLLPADRGKTVSMNNAAANIITIDTNANQAIVVNAVMLLRQLGAGVTTLTAVAGVLLNGIDGGSVDFSAQFDTNSIDQQATDDWIFTGSGTVA